MTPDQHRQYARDLTTAMLSRVTPVYVAGYLTTAGHDVDQAGVLTPDTATITSLLHQATVTLTWPDQTARPVPTRAERLAAARQDSRHLDTTRLVDRLRAAIADPGSHLPRQDGETVANWSARAVIATVLPQLAADLGQARDANDTLALTLAEILGTLTDHSEAGVRSTWISTTRVDRWRAALTTAKTTTAASEAEAVDQIPALTTELERARDTTQRCWRLFKAAAAERDRLADALNRAESARIDREGDLWRPAPDGRWTLDDHTPMTLTALNATYGPTRAVLIVDIEPDDEAEQGTAPAPGSATRAPEPAAAEQLPTVAPHSGGDR